MQTNTS